MQHLPDTFETEFAIYDLNEFLSAMSLFDDPELDFGESSVRISQGGQSLKYFYSDPTVVTTPKSDITMPEPDATFTLKQSVFNQISKASSVLGVPDMVLDVNSETGNDLNEFQIEKMIPQIVLVLKLEKVVHQTKSSSLR